MAHGREDLTGARLPGLARGPCAWTRQGVYLSLGPPGRVGHSVGVYSVKWLSQFEAALWAGEVTLSRGLGTVCGETLIALTAVCEVDPLAHGAYWRGPAREENSRHSRLVGLVTAEVATPPVRRE